jgi:hypothetical protein
LKTRFKKARNPIAENMSGIRILTVNEYAVNSEMPRIDARKTAWSWNPFKNILSVSRISQLSINACARITR